MLGGSVPIFEVLIFLTLLLMFAWWMDKGGRTLGWVLVVALAAFLCLLLFYVIQIYQPPPPRTFGALQL
jgi:hypothetical protein